MCDDDDDDDAIAEDCDFYLLPPNDNDNNDDDIGGEVGGGCCNPSIPMAEPASAQSSKVVEINQPKLFILLALCFFFGKPPFSHTTHRPVAVSERLEEQPFVRGAPALSLER